MKDKPKILVIDDDPMIRKTLSDILKAKGYEVITAKDGTEGIAEIGRGFINLALVDLQLPDISGIEVLARIKTTSPSTESIILTAHATMETAIEATNSGAFSYLLKPYDIQQLLLHIHHALDKQQTKEALQESEEKFRSISSSAYDAIIMMDDKGIISFWNEAAEKMFGYQKDEAIGKDILKLIVPNGFYEQYLKGLEKFRDTGQGAIIGKVLVLPAMRKDGTEFYADHAFSSLKLGRKWHAISIVRDITDRILSEKNLKIAIQERDNSIREMKQLMDFSDLMREESQEEDVIRHMAQVLKEQFHPDILAVFMLDTEKNMLDIPIIYPPTSSDKLIKPEVILDPALCRVIRTGHESIVRDIRKEPSCECFLEKIEEGGYVCVPIVTGKTIAGVVMMVKKEKGYWERKELHESIKVYVGIAESSLHRVRLLRVTRNAAIMDVLTGIYNRRFFDEMLEKQITLAKRRNDPLSLLIFDLDYFKKINDTYGHKAGDNMLQELTKGLKNSLRQSDILARYGGEEFAIIMPATDIASALEKAESLRKQVESGSFGSIVPGQSLKITISIGVATFQKHGTESATLVTAADRALYKAKEGGRNRVETP